MKRTYSRQNVCPKCGETYNPTGTDQIYCSRKCYGLDRRGDKHHRYKGGNISPIGYKRICVGGILMHEHRYVVENHLGRKLVKGEVVHHKDGNRLNNSIDNLEVVINQSEHVKLHCLRFRSETHKECASCGVVKERCEFYRGSKARKDPHHSYCKICMKEKYPDKRWPKKS